MSPIGKLVKKQFLGAIIYIFIHLKKFLQPAQYMAINGFIDQSKKIQFK
uniref:Uncharacterized protein n=1 Tax=Anguilla anguilla TaxID=7936 RepID=A0A0E9SRI5_ANGAN